MRLRLDKLVEFFKLLQAHTSFVIPFMEAQGHGTSLLFLDSRPLAEQVLWLIFESRVELLEHIYTVTAQEAQLGRRIGDHVALI